MSARSSALVVFSGGQDSTTCLYWARQKFSSLECLSFDYGQRHSIELECARKLCHELKIPHRVVPLHFLSQLAPSALTDATQELTTSGGFQNLPSSFVPGRNILFLTLAGAYAATRGIKDIVVGVCQTDYSGYPDCREEFVASMQTTLQRGLDVGDLVIHRPLMNLSKAQTFKLADDLGHLADVIEKSHTCYKGERGARHVWGYGCGECPACLLRKKGFEEFLALR